MKDSDTKDTLKVVYPSMDNVSAYEKAKDIVFEVSPLKDKDFIPINFWSLVLS